MFDIKSMSDEDKFFNFISGLQPWAQIELQRQVVRDLPSVIATVDGLVDFRITSSSPLKLKKGKNAGKKNPSKRDGWRKEGISKKFKPRGLQEKKDLRYFIYDSPHRTNDCPKCGKINAMVKETKVEPLVVEANTSQMNPLQLMNDLREEVAHNDTNQGLMVTTV